MNNRLYQSLYFILPTMFWGGSFLGIHYLIEGFDTAFAVLLRVALACLIVKIYIVGFLKNKTVLGAKIKIYAMGVGLVTTAIPWLYLFWAEKHVAPAMAGIVNGMVPLFVTIFTLVFKLDKPNFNKIFGITLGMIGIFTVFSYDIFDGQMFGHRVWAVWMMAFFYTAGILLCRWLTPYIPAIYSVYYQLLGSTLFLIPVNFAMNDSWILSGFTFKVTLALVYLSVFSTAFAQFVFLDIIAKYGSIRAASLVLFVPVVSIFFDSIFLKKTLPWYQVLGAVIVMFSLLVTNQSQNIFIKLKNKLLIPCLKNK